MIVLMLTHTVPYTCIYNFHDCVKHIVSNIPAYKARTSLNISTQITTSPSLLAPKKDRSSHRLNVVPLVHVQMKNSSTPTFTRHIKYTL